MLHYSSLVREITALVPRGLLWGLSNDYDALDTPLTAAAAIVHVPLGYPLRGFHSLAHPGRQFDFVRERMLHFDVEVTSPPVDLAVPQRPNATYSFATLTLLA